MLTVAGEADSDNADFAQAASNFEPEAPGSWSPLYGAPPDIDEADVLTIGSDWEERGHSYRLQEDGHGHQSEEDIPLSQAHAAGAAGLFDDEPFAVGSWHQDYDTEHLDNATSGQPSTSARGRGRATFSDVVSGLGESGAQFLSSRCRSFETFSDFSTLRNRFGWRGGGAPGPRCGRHQHTPQDHGSPSFKDRESNAQSGRE